MLKYISSILFAVSLSVNADCEPIQYQQRENIVVLGKTSEPGISVANLLWFPKLVRLGEIVVDKGPLIAIVSNKSYVSYRRIGKSEVGFIGSKKSPYNFFKEAFTKPSDLIECSFADGFRDIKKKSYYVVKDLEFFVHEWKENTMIYVLSKSADIVVEVTTKRIPHKEAINQIISKTYIK